MSETELGKVAEGAAVAQQPAQSATQPETAEVTTHTEAAPGGADGSELQQETEDIATRLQRTEEELRQAKHEAEIYRSVVSQKGGLQTPAVAETSQPDEPPPAISPEEWYADPGTALTKMFSWKDRKDKAEREKQSQAQTLREAKQTFDSTFNNVVAKHGKLMAGIEREVGDAVIAAYRDGKIGIRELSDPNMFLLTASVIRQSKGEYDLSKYFGSNPKPVAAVKTALPTAAKPPKDAATATEEERYLAKQAGLTAEQYLATKKALKDEEGR